MKERKCRIKRFLVAVRCFIKQTLRIAKYIFGTRDTQGVEYRDLAPIDDVSGCEEHIKALEWAVASNRIKISPYPDHMAQEKVASLRLFFAVIRLCKKEA